MEKEKVKKKDKPKIVVLHRATFEQDLEALLGKHKMKMRDLMEYIMHADRCDISYQPAGREAVTGESRVYVTAQLEDDSTYAFFVSKG